jgi:succinylarginine dihydrolase
MSVRAHLTLHPLTLHPRALEVPVNELVVAGWTGRDQAAIEAHVREMKEWGVAGPTQTPMYYRVAASLLTTADEIEVIGRESSG